jgi:hypothetical protein
MLLPCMKWREDLNISSELMKCYKFAISFTESILMKAGQINDLGKSKPT